MTCVSHLNCPMLRHKKMCGLSLFKRPPSIYLKDHYPFIPPSISSPNTTCRINFCWLLGLKELLIEETALNKAESATGSTELLLKSYSPSYSYVKDFYPLIFMFD